MAAARQPLFLQASWHVVPLLLCLLAGAYNSQVQAQSADPGSTLLALLQSLLVNSTFSTVVQAVVAANLTGPVTTLADTTGITLFAPSNDAFQALGNSTVTCLVTQPDLPLLTSILQYHVIKGVYNSTTLAAAAPLSLASVNGKALNFTTQGSSVLVNGVKVTAPDAIQLPGSAVVHGVPSVLVYPGGLEAVQALCSSPANSTGATPLPTARGTVPPSSGGAKSRPLLKGLSALLSISLVTLFFDGYAWKSGPW